MQKKTQVALGVLILGVLPLPIQAEDCCLPSYQPGTPLCEDEVCTMYPAFAGVKLDCGFNVFSYAEFLYWAALTSQSYAVTTFEGIPSGSVQDELFHRYGYRPAFKVGIGMVMPDGDDNWVASAEYLWYHHDFTKTFSRPLPVTLAGAQLPFTNPIYSTVSDKLKLHYDIVSVNLGRPNYLGERMIFSPYLTFKWFRRNLKTSQNLSRAGTGLVDHQQTKLSFSSIGLGSGVTTDWLLCWGARLIGKVEFGLFIPYRRTNKETTKSAEGIISNTNAPLRHIDVLTISGLGIGWGKYYCCNRYHLDVAATYDFFGEISELDFNSGMFTKAEMMMHGLTISGRFDF